MNDLSQTTAEDEISTLRNNLADEFQDVDYRYAYAESFLNTKLASQIRAIRQQRELTQVDIAGIMGIKQSGYARFEDVNHSVWRTDTLWKIARALDVRVNISLETFGSLIDDKERFSRKQLERPAFENDPAFNPEQNSFGTAVKVQTGTYDAHTMQFDSGVGYGHMGTCTTSTAKTVTVGTSFTLPTKKPAQSEQGSIYAASMPEGIINAGH